MGIKRGHVHLWHIRTEDAKRRGWLATYNDLQTDKDRERHQRFVFEKDRDQFLIARALVRTTLSRYADVQPEDWHFQLNEFGKPSISARQTSPGLSFNLSHCDGLLLCGITVGCDIGVDCENCMRDVEIDRLAPRVFSVGELEYFNSVPFSQRSETFFRLWTLKEAYIKARGMGLSLPLQKFSIDFVDPLEIRIGFEQEIQDMPQQWQFFQPAFAKPFVAAVAVNLNQNEPLRLDVHAA